MKKRDLINTIAQNADLENVTKKNIETIVNTFINVVTMELKNKSDISLHGLGTFKIVNRKARVINSKYAKNYKIPAHKTIIFKVASSLKNLFKANK
jgi:DNA-binding protein HU-beta